MMRETDKILINEPDSMLPDSSKQKTGLEIMKPVPGSGLCRCTAILWEFFVSSARPIADPAVKIPSDFCVFPYHYHLQFISLILILFPLCVIVPLRISYAWEQKMSQHMI